MRKLALATALAAMALAGPAQARGAGLDDRCAWVDGRDGKSDSLCWWFDRLDAFFGYAWLHNKYR